MTQTRFRNEGCPNCPFLELRGNSDALDSCTSTVFEGLITVANPKRSWVAKWQRLESYVPGVYATKVSGSIPEDIRNGLIEDGHVLIPLEAPGELAALNNTLIDIDDDAGNDQPQHDPTTAPNDGNDNQHDPGSAPAGGQDGAEQQFH
ncbi:hypothetical protein CHU98_g10799 [Xylaria longipes]|nr:hypothetical protein CHU98_g10799 [Xylaria longipes]